MVHLVELTFEQPVEGIQSGRKDSSWVGRAGIRPLQGAREYAVCGALSQTEQMTRHKVEWYRAADLYPCVSIIN